MANTAYLGAREVTSDTSDFNAHVFLIEQMLAAIPGSSVVKVISCTNAGGLSPVGFVDVQPLVNQIDGNGVATPHGIIHNLPYARLQGGQNAVVLDPQAGDIGIAVFCDRDISSVKTNKAQANPGSRRQHDWADGVYLFGILNGTPTQYIQFTSSGITITTPGTLTLNAANIVTTGTLTSNGANISNTHVHPDPQGGVTGPPQ